MNDILLLGGSGSLGRSFSRKLNNIISLPKSSADLTRFDVLTQLFEKYKPKTIINCAAYTQVDASETNRQLAFMVNAQALVNLGNLAARYGSKLCHFSTDYVFDGISQTPYTENDLPSPINWYGQTKAFGDFGLLSVNPQTLIIRISFPYGLEYPNSFVGKMLQKLAAKQTIEVLCDRWIYPTWVDDLVDATSRLLENRISGIVNFCNSGEAPSLFRYAQEIESIKYPKTSSLITPITRDKIISSPAARPIRALLDTNYYAKLTGDKTPNWQDSLKKYLGQIN